MRTKELVAGRELKFQSLASRLRQEIISGAWPAATKLPPDVEIVEATGLSLTTVRRAYELLVDEGLVIRRQGAGTFVCPRARHGYSRNGRIGVLVPESDYYFSRVIQGIESTLSSRGFEMIVATSGYDVHREQHEVTSLVEQKADGIIVAPAFSQGRREPNRRQIEVLGASGFPILLLERSFPRLGPVDHLEHVVSDHAGGAFDAVRHLLALGHERIALIVRQSPHTAPGVHAGYHAACDSGSIEPVVIQDDASAWSLGRAHEAVSELLEKRCTAALVFGGQEAVLIQQSASRIGLTVPDDIALISYDDEEAEHAAVPLSAVAPAKFHMGSSATEILLRRIEGGDRAPVHQIRLRPRLIVRESCGAKAPERRSIAHLAEASARFQYGIPQWKPS